MRTKAVSIALAVAAATLGGCQKNDTGTAAPTATTPASSAPADNGVAALTADEILAKAKAALGQAKSFHAKGNVVQGADKTDVDLKVNGTDFIGSISMKAAKVELLAIGKDKYIRPNEQFWTLTTGARGKTMATLVGNRWVTGAGNDKSFAELFSIGSVDELLKPTGKLTKGEPKTIDGVQTIGLKDSADPDSVLYVATTGEPYPVQLAGKDSSALTFSEYKATFSDIAKPAAADVIDLGKLGGK
jgi:hypothetical protein